MFVCVHACMPLVLTNFLCLLPPLFLSFIYVNTAKAINSVIRWPSHSGHVTDRQTDRIQTDRHTPIYLYFSSPSVRKKKWKCCLHPCLLLLRSPSQAIRESPHHRRRAPCIRAALMKGIIHYKVFDLRMIYSPLPRRRGAGKPSWR